MEEVRFNKLLIDWLAFTVHGMQVDEVIDLIGFKKLIGEFTDGRGFNGYQDRLFFESISVHYNGKENQGIHVEMSGQGCRAFESYSELDSFDELICRILSLEKYKITRLDVAYDDFNDCLPIAEIVDSVKAGEWFSPSNMQWWEAVYSSAGLTCYIGSPRSRIRFRFYDKAAEKKQNYQWTRLEIQMRDADATLFLQQLYCGEKTINEMFFGIINRYIKFIEFDNTRKTRCSLKPWWASFLETSDMVKLEFPCVQYNLSNLLNTIDRTGNSIHTYISLFGVPALLAMLSKDKAVKDMPKKFKDLMKHYLDDYAEGHIKLKDHGEFEELEDLPKRLQNLLEELEE